VDPFGAREPTSADLPKYPPPVTAAVDAHPARDVASASGPVPATLFASPFVPGGPGDPILGAIRNATRTIEVEQLNLPVTWRGAGGVSGPNAYLEGLTEAARRGVQVQVLLDGHFLSDDESPDNGDTADQLNALGPGATVAARIMAGRDAPVLHVKGLIVDDESFLVGSMNWNLNSLAQDREVDVLLHDARLAAYFHSAFDADWIRAARHAASPGVPEVAILITLAMVCVRARRSARPR